MKASGLIIPEVFSLIQKTFSKVDPRELDLSKKEISELLAERRRLNQFYREPLRTIAPGIRQYMEQKGKLVSLGEDIVGSTDLGSRRGGLIKKIAAIDLHQEEILLLSEKFTNAEKKIKRYRKEQRKIERRLRVSSSRELRTMGRGLATAEQRRRIEADLDLSADEIKEKIRQIQINEKKLKNLEVEFEETIESILEHAERISKGQHMMKGGEGPANTGQPAPRRQHRQEIYQPGASLFRSGTGREYRAYQGGRKVRVPQGLQVFDLRHLVDSPGDHPLDFGSGSHYPGSSSHDRTDQQGSP